MPTKKKPLRCKWCELGNTPNERGEHWLVRSVFPARIDIRECKFKMEETNANDERNDERPRKA
jgi:hypothetical protein